MKNRHKKNKCNQLMVKVALALTLGIVLVGNTNLANAQGSSFDLLGFGEPVITRVTHLQGMGGAGVAAVDERSVSDINPASWSWLNRARFEVYGTYAFNSATFNSAQSDALNVHFDGFSFGAPFSESLKASVSLGFTPLTDATAEIAFTDSSGSKTYRSDGGASMAYLGFSAEPANGIALGARLDLIFGNVAHRDNLTFVDQNIATGNFERTYALNGLRPTIGVILSGDSIQGLHGINLGAVFSPSASLSSKLRTVVTPISSILDTTIESVGNASFPSSIGVGASVKLSPRYRALADIMLQSYSTSFLYSTSTSAPDSSLRNATRIAFGIERVANFNNEFGMASFWDRLGLRLGAYYYQTPFAPAGTGGINEMAITAGIGIPISYESSWDFSLTLGQRTPTNANTAPSDKFIRIGTSFSLSEKWFSPTRTED